MSTTVGWQAVMYTGIAGAGIDRAHIINN